MLKEAVIFSIIMGFLSTEFLGLATGGFISSGYLAFYLEQPLRIFSTLILSLLIFGIIKILQSNMIIYGRRRFMTCVVLSLIVSWFVEHSSYFLSFQMQDIRIIGYVVPGLIANDMLKQGVWKTLSILLIISVLIRLVLLVRL